MRVGIRIRCRNRVQVSGRILYEGTARTKQAWTQVRDKAKAGAQAPADAGLSGQPLPAQAVDLLHDLADFLLHLLAGLALGGELHQADPALSFAEIDGPAVFFAGDADFILVIATLHMIQTGGNQMLFEKLL